MNYRPKFSLCIVAYFTSGVRSYVAWLNSMNYRPKFSLRIVAYVHVLWHILQVVKDYLT